MAGASRAKAGAGHAMAAALLLSTAMFLWAGNFITARAVRGVLDPLALNFWRWALALVVLLPMALPRFDRRQARLAATH